MKASLPKLLVKVALASLTVVCVNLAGNHTANQALAQGAQFDMSSIVNAVQTGLMSGRQILPPVSTGSVDINTCDMPFLRSNGGSGAFPNAGGGPGGSGPGGPGSTGPVPAPALPPGYVGMTNSHSGDYMGYIPPGGNLYDWSRGVYGLTPGQEAEATYLWSSGQLAQGFASGMFAGTGISMGGP